MAKEPQQYGTHTDFYGRVSEPANARALEVASALSKAFSKHIKREEVDVIIFKDLTALELAQAIQNYPIILKPILAACNIAGRAIERDLSIKNVDTYKPRINKDQAQVIAGYIKPFLPVALAVPAIAFVDRVSFIDKEIRKGKGQWEKLILESINRLSGKEFKKRKFSNHGELFELDAAFPITGDVSFGVDVKRIEARRDIHKRSDEIINKAAKVKEVYPKAKFGAVIYYPFIEEHSNVQDRLRSPNIDSVVFAGESGVSIENAVKLLLSKLGIKI